MEQEKLDELVSKYKTKWLGRLTKRMTLEEAKSAILPVWEKVYGCVPEVKLYSSPYAARQDELEDSEEYFSLWTVSYAATYELQKEAGAAFDDDKLEELIKWADCCHYLYYNRNVVHVSQYPTVLHINENDQLHCDDGPALMYEDGLGIYSLNGVDVDEQIVMRPETQTIDQIRNETNEEVRVHRMERYGYEKYLEAIDAELIDENRNDIEGTLEFLFKGKISDKDSLVVLLTNCPSTLKKFALQVPPTIKTCKEAQSWLSSGLSNRIISAS